MKMDVPDDFGERFIKVESQVDDMHAAWNNGGSPGAQRISTRVDGLVLCASVVVLGFCGWLGWLTLQLEKCIR